MDMIARDEQTVKPWAGIMVVSLWQPWATLVVKQLKRIETRGKATPHRGPLAIHAAQTVAGIDMLPGDCEGNEEDGMRYGYIGPYQASYITPRSPNAEKPFVRRAWLNINGEEEELPLGAIIGFCNLTACEYMSTELINLVPEPEKSFGLYKPGRYMWMLDGAREFTQPIPCKGHQWLWHSSDPCIKAAIDVTEVLDEIAVRRVGGEA